MEAAAGGEDVHLHVEQGEALTVADVRQVAEAHRAPVNDRDRAFAEDLELIPLDQNRRVLVYAQPDVLRVVRDRGHHAAHAPAL